MRKNEKSVKYHCLTLRILNHPLYYYFYERMPILLYRWTQAYSFILVEAE